MSNKIETHNLNPDDFSQQDLRALGWVSASTAAGVCVMPVETIKALIDCGAIDGLIQDGQWFLNPVMLADFFADFENTEAQEKLRLYRERHAAKYAVDMESLREEAQSRKQRM